ncbi:helix-hairpin-helix domain-containing protein [Microbacterium sp. NPDC055910]|uniref:helix-hairpin-helix domain-containing protein n=1 Tax=Microbacterium sp. NPDC055910 TaxID=3345659 RepID=UPI0035DDBCF2
MTTAEDPPATRRRLGVGAAVVLVIATLAVTVGIGIVRGAVAPVESVAFDEVTDAPRERAPDLYAHVSGAVVAPGLYVLHPGARVVDAIAAAGGFVDGAARDAVNLARPLSDGEQVVVPKEGDEPASADIAPVTDGRVNLNVADATTLETLPRVGPAIAQRIIEWREQHGRFTSVDDLLAVAGIGDKMLESLRDLVTV